LTLNPLALAPKSPEGDLIPFGNLREGSELKIRGADLSPL
jgi:hypothetical protein